MQLNHYLNFQGETEAAFLFYQSVFGGEFSFLKRYSELPDVQVSEHEQDYLLHISLPINEFTVLMGSDTTEQFCAQSHPSFSKGNNHYISINLEAHEVEEARRLFQKLSVNGQIEMALAETFWGGLYGAFTDQFGIKWMVNCQLNAE